jgi:hypothetical protein
LARQWVVVFLDGKCVAQKVVLLLPVPRSRLSEIVIDEFAYVGDQRSGLADCSDKVMGM